VASGNAVISFLQEKRKKANVSAVMVRFML
jgi:hypothetical protein